MWIIRPFIVKIVDGWDPNIWLPETNFFVFISSPLLIRCHLILHTNSNRKLVHCFNLTWQDLNTGAFRIIPGIPLASEQKLGRKSGMKALVYFPWRFNLVLGGLFFLATFPICSQYLVTLPTTTTTTWLIWFGVAHII